VRERERERVGISLGLASSDYDKQQFIYYVLIPGYSISGFFGGKISLSGNKQASKKERKKVSNPCRQVQRL